MACRPLSLEQLKQAMRVELCQRCPYRTEAPGPDDTVGPLPCEAQCPVFLHLPVLKETAERLDPLVGHHEQTLLSTISQILRESVKRENDKDRLASLRYHRRRLARRLGKLLNR